MVVFTVYSVVMRYYFEDPPVWGDLLTVLSNIWLVFLALGVDGEGSRLTLRSIWSIRACRCRIAFRRSAVLVVGDFRLGYRHPATTGVQVVSTMGGKYWEMWYFAWEDGSIVFKPNYMPKKYAMAILPITGVLTSIAALMAVLEDCIRYAKGTFRLAGDDEAEIV